MWKARDTRLDRIVAIKRLKGEYSERFQKEARAIAALNHPNICQLYDVGPDYLVMEFIEGRILQGPKPEAEVARIALQFASALEEAHRRGVIHRDLKPGNMMIAESGLAKLLDFGIAKHASSSDTSTIGTGAGVVMGTAAYMAPEQAEGKLLDERSDIFSFGAVLYELLSGRRAFEGNSTAEVMGALLRDTPPQLSCHPALERVVMRCLQKHPGQRFQTVTEMKAALEQVPVPVLSGTARGAEREMEPSIAVLPFANMSADKENEYFSDGLAEEIINALAHIPGLKVTARTSAFAFRGKELDIRKIAETLGVRTVLEGSVRRAGNRVRVTAQLISAGDGYHLWSERYDREMADVFIMQDEIAQAIASALQVKLSGQTSPQPRRYTPSVPAFEALLKARHHTAQFTPESFKKAKECFEQAIAIDPHFALAHAEFGLAFLVAAILTILPARQAMPLVRIHAEKALEIDQVLPEAHQGLGVVAALFDYDWREAERRFKQAMSHEPVSAFVRLNYAAWYLTFVGRFDEAVTEFRRALQEDPLNTGGRLVLTSCLILKGDLDEAVAEARQSLEINPGFAPAWSQLSLIHYLRGKSDEAYECAEKAYSLSPWVPMATGALAGQLLRRGDKNRSDELLRQLGDGQAYGAAYGLAIHDMFSGATDRLPERLERLIEQRYPMVPGLLRGPIGKSLRSHPRWPAIVEMVRLPNL